MDKVDISSNVDYYGMCSRRNILYFMGSLEKIIDSTKISSVSCEFTEINWILRDFDAA